MASTYEFDSLKNSVDRLYDWLDTRDFKIHANWTMDDLIKVHKDVESLGQKVRKINGLYRRNVLRPLVEEAATKAGQKMANMPKDADPQEVMALFNELKSLQTQMSSLQSETIDNVDDKSVDNQNQNLDGEMR